MALSYSALSTFKKCPKKYYFGYVERLPRGDASPAMLRGTEIHQTIEDFTNGKREDLHPEIHERFGQFFLGLRSHGLQAEVKWGLNNEWELCDFDDPDAMLRGVMDGVLEPHVYEYKTGKCYEEHFDQMCLYGMVQLIRHPDVPEVVVTNIYLDGNTGSRQITYPQAMLNNYKDMHYHRIMDILNEETFAPNPSYACRWCAYSRQNGGPCDF